jgi:nucleoside-diphosphate-sugar epimerase
MINRRIQRKQRPFSVSPLPPVQGVAGFDMADYKGKRVLVTGGTGFIGGRLAERLSFEHQAEVVILLRDWRRAVWASRLPAKLMEGDVLDPPSLARAMEACELVFHCAMGSGPVNRDGTRNVLEAARAAGVQRVVHLSTIGVHGPNPPDHADESTPMLSVGDDYGDSKLAAEEVVAEFTRQHRLSVVTLRPTFVWGPRSEAFALEPIRLIREGKWQLVDDGLGTCHAVYVDNLVDAMVAAGVTPDIDGQVFLITDGQPCTWGEFFMAYARMLGVNSLPSVSSKRVASHPLRRVERVLTRLHDALGRVPRPEPIRTCCRGSRYILRKIRRLLGPMPLFRDWDVIKYSRRGGLNTSKAKKRLGYVPRISRDEGMRQVEMWLRDQRFIS